MPEQPNIVLILSDDMGYSDIGCYGSEIETPNLDKLAAGGVRFSQMYNCARCCPTRASLLTGLAPHQAGVGHMVGNAGHPSYQGYLRDDCATIAEVLGEAGYRTLMSGKWHVGGGYAGNHPESWCPGEEGHPIPVQRGFDEHYGMLGGGGSYFDPPYMVRNDRLIRPGLEDGYYLTDAITDEAVRMIREASVEPVAGAPAAGNGMGRTAADTAGDPDQTQTGSSRELSADCRQPFFLYVGYTAPHWPLHALPDDIEKYRGRYRKGGWDALRDERLERLRSLGVLEPAWALSPRDEGALSWSDVEARDWEDLRMAVYAAQIDRMDQGIGRIIGSLESSGQLEDTLILFLSDNGGCAEFLAEDSDRAEPFRYDVPTPDGRSMRIGNTPKIDPGPDDTFASYDLPWANASNTPFRLFKHWVHEGGISTPFIAHWPAAAKEASIFHGPAHVSDIAATCLAAAGVKYPSSRNGIPITPIEGESFLPVLNGREWSRERPIVLEHEGNCAVRTDEWKLVRRYPGTWELYNMTTDRTELIDCADSERVRTDSMSAMYEEWASRAGVIPWERLSYGG